MIVFFKIHVWLRVAVINDIAWIRRFGIRVVNIFRNAHPLGGDVPILGAQFTDESSLVFRFIDRYGIGTTRLKRAGGEIQNKYTRKKQ